MKKISGPGYVIDWIIIEIAAMIDRYTRYDPLNKQAENAYNRMVTRGNRRNNGVR